ncbi:MAG: hypothetical protein PHI66_01200 [Candidatus Pacebacteria bacterium]|nr:hypothetical protein [Candidatus Paceibacterota bacterium]
MQEDQKQKSAYAPLWEIVEKELEKNDISANKVAVMETEKIFKKVLEEKNIPGKDTEDRIKNYKELFQNPDKLKYARAMYKKIVSESGFDISADDTREIIKGYHEAIENLEEVDFNDFSIKEKLNLFLGRYFYSFPQKSKKIIAAILALCLITFVLTETETGQNAALRWVTINNYLFYKIIPTVLMLIAAVLLVVAALFFYKNRKKK